MHRITKLFLFFIFIISTSLADPLPANEAFQLSTALENSNILISWKIAPHYYLYKDRMHFSSNPNILGNPEFPSPKIKSNPILGHYPVYEHSVTVKLPLLSNAKAIDLKIAYQGCSAEGFCYPPTTETIHFASTNSTNQISTLFNTDHWMVLLVSFFGFGLLISLTPCILPMIPILSSIILGQKNITHARTFLLTSLYVLGMAIAYTAAGIFFSLLGSNVQNFLQTPFMIVLFSGIFVMMAFSLFDYYQIQLPLKIRSYFANNAQKIQKGNFLGAFLMGALSILILSPCVTPPLIAVLGYVSQKGNILLGGSALFIMAVGMSVPLLIIGFLGPRFLPKTGKWMNVCKYILGILLLGFAIGLLQRILPAWSSMLLWASLIIVVSLKLGFLVQLKPLKIGLQIMSFMYGILLIVATIQGNYSPFHPLNFYPKKMQFTSDFTMINNLQELQQQLTLAKKQNRNVLIDFYADWCIACVIMEKYTFPNAEVKSAMQNFVRLKIDLTKNDDNKKIMLQKFNVVAPPTILFFDHQGNEMNQFRIIGEISSRKLLNQLHDINLGKNTHLVRA